MIGFPLSALIASAGHRVTGLDADRRRVEALGRGVPPVDEPGVEPLFREAVGAGRYRATSDPSEAVAGAEVVVLIVPVPLGPDRRADLSALLDACGDVGRHLSRGALVVVETTLPPGTTAGPVRAALEGASGMAAGRDFFLAHSPERVMNGTILEQMRSYPKVVGGFTAACLERASAFYATFCPSVLAMPDLASAELEKVAEGVYRDVNIALANQLARVCEELGADFDAVRRAATSQPFCHLHRPSAGVGGLCIPVYPHFLPAQGKGDVVSASRELNESMPRFVAERALELSGKGASILVLGLSFRAGVKDLRLSPTLEVVRILREAGRTVRVADPHFTADEVRAATGCGAEMEGGFILVLTAEGSFGDVLAARPRTPALDCTGRFPQARFQLGRNVR
jgi:nucleotide sugar dehydrogenase